MYQIIKNGTTLGYAEHPTYVAPLENGAFGLTDEAEARGVVYEGEVYHLEGREALEDKETVLLIPVDAGVVSAKNLAAIAELESQITDAQMALCDVYEMTLGGAE